jgi:hypothetical protein
METGDFDDIRPYNDEEVPSAINRIISARRVKSLLLPFLPEDKIDVIVNDLNHVNSVYGFQNDISRKIVAGILKKSGTDLYCKNIEHLGQKNGYLFISNHRDIVLDPSFLAFLLNANGYETVEIAIGNNLLIEPWIEDLVRVNRSFVVRRDLQGRDLFYASEKISRYIRYVINSKQTNVWIAQREGRAKDGNDATQISLLKMLNMSAESKQLRVGFLDLHIIPVSITYEYDPCDVLKAKELYLQSFGTDYVKTAADDLLSMKWGLLGLKGRVSYNFSKEISKMPFSDETDLNSACDLLANEIDRRIYEGYEMFPSHFYSFDAYHTTSRFKDRYTEEDVKKFELLIDDKIRTLLPEFMGNSDFRKQVYKQYSNVLKNAFTVNPKIIR